LTGFSTTTDPNRGNEGAYAVHVLCYEHHIEMKLVQVLLKLRSEAAETLVYACPEPGCQVRYQNLRGYFVVVQEANTIERDMVPTVRCSQDGQLMYLAEVRPEKKSFRLWKCPKCNTSWSNQEFRAAIIVDARSRQSGVGEKDGERELWDRLP
jgi:hypothetical protein